MNWLSLDTDIFQDGKIKSLLQQQGSNGYLVYNYLLTQVASDIDIDNDQSGYLDIGNGKKPQAELAWDLHLDQNQIKEIIETLADLELIDPDEWKSKEIFIPKLLDRELTQRYLKEQEGGRKGGSSIPGEKDKGESRGVKGGFKGDRSHPSTNKEQYKDKDKKTNVADSKSDDNFPKYSKDSKPYQLASKLKTLIRENDKYTQLPNSSVKALQDWADSIRKMQEYGESANDDGASFAYEEIDDLIEFSQEDEFWKQNILSASKLRKQAGKLMQRMKEKDNSKRDDGGRPSQVTDADRKVAKKREEWMDNE